MNKAIKALLDLLNPEQDEVGTFPIRGRAPTPQKKARPAIRQNHGKGESKVRRKMADRSRKINRRRQ